MKIGSHVSNSGDSMLLGAVKEALSYGSNCLMIYLGAPQNSYRKDLAVMQIEAFRTHCQENAIALEDVIVHAPYILNLAQSDVSKQQFAIDFLVKEIMMMDAIGLKTIVVHPGSFLQLSPDEGFDIIADSLRIVLKRTENTSVTIALETMAGKGSECCFVFDHLAHLIKVLNDPRIKICLDTCHTFDSGYDWVNTYDDVIEQLDQIIGIHNIAVIHLNDSKNPCASKKDRHENIGFGYIGFPTLAKICHDKRFSTIPKILETPYIENSEGKKEFPPYKEEINMLRENIFNPAMKELIQAKHSG